jgi:glutamyl-tRNA synthetase
MTDQKEFRGRAAPSPTGRVHIGNLRTFLFNSLFLRKHGGTNILRVEDTDEKRKVEKGLEGILEVPDLYGIKFQEGPGIGGDYGPYIQTERRELYIQHAERLVEEDKAYYCFCSEERLSKLRERQKERKAKPGYDRKCRDLDPEEAQRRVDEGEECVIRLKFPLTGETNYHDAVFGDLKFDNKEMEDIVILKSDKLPTYNFAVVVDDHLMEVTHAMRAREYLSEIPKNVFIYESLGWEPVQYVHVPEVLNSDGRGKLGKRSGALPAVAYLRKGYLREAMINFLALLGWAPKPEDVNEDEIYTEEELVELFSIDRVHKSPARYDKKKLDYMNGKHIRRLSVEELANRVVDWAENLVLQEFITDRFEEHPKWEVELQSKVEEILPKWKADRERFVEALKLVHERVVYLGELPDLLYFLYTDELEWSKEDWRTKNHSLSEIADALDGVLPKLDEAFKNGVEDHDLWEETVRDYADELDWKHGELFMAIRSATTGKLKSPPLFESFQVLGWNKASQFIEESIKWLKKQ